MKTFQKDIKSKLKNLLFIVVAAGAYIGGRHISAGAYEQNLQNQSRDFAKKEAAYKEKIKDLQAAKRDIRFYDISPEGLRNSYVDSLNYRRFVPMKRTDYSGFELHMPGEKEIKHAVSHLKPLEQRSFARVEKQKKILVNKINACPQDSTDLFFRSCKDYRRTLIKEMAMLYDRGAGRIMYLSLPPKYVAEAFNAANKKLGKADNDYQNMLIAAEMRFMEDALAVREVVEVNNQAVKDFQVRDSLKAVEHKKVFDYQQRIRRQMLVDSLVKERERKKQQEVRSFVPLELFRVQKSGWRQP